MSEPVADIDDPRWSGLAAPEPDDAGHLLPDRAWQAVVEGAEARAAFLELPDDLPARRTLPDRTITARSHGGVMPGGPRLGVIHSAETPLVAGYAYSIAANWFATQATTSAHVMIDPAETVRLLPDNVVSYAVGSAANGFTLNVEQAGRAAFTVAQWTTEPGLRQRARVAEFMRESRDRWGIPLRWASDDEIRRAKSDPSFRAGWCTHDDIRRVLGKTTHTDPGRNYPEAALMAEANSDQQEEEMPLTEAEAELVARKVWERVIVGKDVPAYLAMQQLTSRDPMVNPISQAVIDRVVVGGSNARTDPPIPVWLVLRALYQRPGGATDIDAVVAAVVRGLPAATGGISKTDVEDAVRAVFADGGQR